jgi:hypothetical protein
MAWMPSPRLAALAVMGMLAFGSELGAAVGATGALSPAASTLIVIRGHGAQPPMLAAAAPAQAPSGGGSSGGGTSSGGGSTAPAPSSSPAAAPAASAPTTTTSSGSGSSASTNPYGLPAIKHVFLIVMADQGYSQTFASQDPYMGKTLPKQGKLLPFYYGVTGSELANQIALVSGQGPTAQTESGCSVFTGFKVSGAGKHGQLLGSGCVYPRQVQTLGDQLTAAHLTWKAYVQGMANGQPGQAQTCRHPALGAGDMNQSPQPGDPYMTGRNPFVYFKSVLGTRACVREDVDFTQLSTDLTNISSTPNLSYIVPDPCDDGNPQPCQPGATAGPAQADSFLRTVLIEIKSSPAYQAGGLIAITSDAAPQTGPNADPSSCCATPKYPNLPATAPTNTAPATPTTTTTTTTPAAGTPTTTSSTTTTAPTTSTSTTSSTSTTTTTTSPPNLGRSQGQTSPTGGGGQIGLLLISPWVKPGTSDPVDYFNHYSLLASLENIFNLKRLGYAKQLGLTALDGGTFDGAGPSAG